MKLFLIRHADAIEYETEAVNSDELRFITPAGRSLTHEIANLLRDEFNDLDKIFTSPLVRAVQTAEILASEINFKNDIELVNELKNETSVASVQALINKNSNLNSVVFVGHEPKISLLVRSLSDKKYFHDFSKSSVCLIDFENKSETGKYKWYFNSKEMEFEK